jgi:hypothetical protein
VPALVVEEFPSPRAEEKKNVLEVRRGARGSAKCRWIERSSPHGKEDGAREATANLELARVEISVRNAIARNVENRAEEECRESRATGGAGRGACRHVDLSLSADVLAGKASATSVPPTRLTRWRLFALGNVAQPTRSRRPREPVRVTTRCSARVCGNVS